MTQSSVTKLQMTRNAVGRMVPAVVNGAEQVAFAGVDQHRPTGRKAAPAGQECQRLA